MNEKAKQQSHGQLWDNPYDLHDISDQAQIVTLLIDRLEPKLAAVFTPQMAEKINQIYITGCGDSYFAAYAARLAFEKYSGIQTEPIEALEFSRYKVDYLPAGSLVISISNSGQVKRTVETVRLAKKRGAHTIAITGNDQGPLALEADTVLIQSVPEMLENVGPNNVVALGLGNFTASLLTLYLSALHLGQLRGVITDQEAEQKKAELVSSAEIISRTSEANYSIAHDLAAQMWNQETYVIVGGGPSYATAMFTAAKLMEQPQNEAASNAGRMGASGLFFDPTSDNANNFHCASRQKPRSCHRTNSRRKRYGSNGYSHLRRRR